MLISVWRTRIWWIFLLGLLALLALILLPSLTNLQQGKRVYSALRERQLHYDRNRASLDRLSQNLFLISIAIREFLLDNSPDASRVYTQQCNRLRASIESSLAGLRANVYAPGELETLTRLEREWSRYWESIVPVLHWTPAERARQSTYFLREQQRPRRQSVTAIADEIAALNRAFYEREIDSINQSEAEFRGGLAQSIRLALFTGLAVAAVSLYRLYVLEKRDRQQLSRLIQAQEEERRRIARELHDDIGQTLTALRLGLRNADPELKSLAEHSLQAIRGIASGLRPSVLDDLGLGPALQQLARTFSRNTSLSVTTEVNADLTALNDRQKTCLYRIAQEGLTNSAKHANATSASVRVAIAGSTLHMTVADNGSGFPKPVPHTAGTGLAGIQERIRELGGSVKLEGSRMVVELPL